MINPDRDFCLSAVAYLKVQVNEQSNLVLPDEETPVITSLGSDLLISYVVDQGESFSYVQNRHLKAAMLTSEQLQISAIRNLTLLAESEAKVSQYGNVYVVLMDGNFEASLILVNAFWDEWYSTLAPNGFVVAFPARDVLAFCDASSKQAISELQVIIDRAIENADHLLSTNIYRRNEASWNPMEKNAQGQV